MCWALFIFSHYEDYPKNQLPAVPMPPDSAANQEFTVDTILFFLHLKIVKLERACGSVGWSVASGLCRGERHKFELRSTFDLRPFISTISSFIFTIRPTQKISIKKGYIVIQ